MLNQWGGEKSGVSDMTREERMAKRPWYDWMTREERKAKTDAAEEKYQRTKIEIKEKSQRRQAEIDENWERAKAKGFEVSTKTALKVAGFLCLGGLILVITVTVLVQVFDHSLSFDYCVEFQKDLREIARSDTRVVDPQAYAEWVEGCSQYLP